MLGYVLPEKSELKLREYEIYNGYYCGICKYIGRSYGQLPRMALSYDAAFLALFLACIDESEDEPVPEHCIAHHIKHKPVILNRAIEYAGDVMLILAWFKLRDDAADEGKLTAKATARFFKNHYKKLRGRYPILCERIEAHIGELSSLEREKCSSIDRVAESFSLIMSTIFEQGLELVYPERSESDLHETFAKAGYHMGKWVYLIDAADDIDSDLKTGSFNPLIYRFEYRAGEETVDGFRARIDDDLRFNLYSYLAALGEAVASLDIKKNSGIIENIVYFGLNRRTDEVLKRLPPPNRRKVKK